MNYDKRLIEWLRREGGCIILQPDGNSLAAALEELAACREVIARIVNAADATLCDPEGAVCIQGSDGDRAILQAAIDAARRMK